jgi:hypothetical protein
MNFLKLFLITFLIFLFSGLIAKPIKRTNNFYSYRDPLNEMGYGINAAYLKSENKLVPFLQIYYSRYLTSFFSIGACYNGVYSQEFQNSISAKIAFEVFGNLILSLKPGIYIKSKLEKKELLYFIGLESAYKFKLSQQISLGPILDFHFIQDDLYLIGGLQMGFYF